MHAYKNFSENTKVNEYININDENVLQKRELLNNSKAMSQNFWVPFTDCKKFSQ